MARAMKPKPAQPHAKTSSSRKPPRQVDPDVGGAAAFRRPSWAGEVDPDAAGADAFRGPSWAGKVDPDAAGADAFQERSWPGQVDPDAPGASISEQAESAHVPWFGPGLLRETAQQVGSASAALTSEAKLQLAQEALTKLKSTLKKETKRAKQVRKDLLASQAAREKVEGRAMRAEAEVSKVTTKLLVTEGLRELGAAEQERVEAARTALVTARDWCRSLEMQRARIEDLVRRASELPQLPKHLAEKLSALHGRDPRECVTVVGEVLTEALGEAAMAEAVLLRTPTHADSEAVDRSLRSLEAIVDRYGAPHDQEAAVAAGPDGTIDSKVDPGPVTGVDVRDSVGVVRGDNSDVNVIHVCDVQQPVVEVAELMKMSADGPVFGWFSSAYEPGRVAGTSTSVSSNALSVDFWTNIWNSRGVAVGDNISMQITRHHRIKGCRVNLRELLRNDEVRSDLAASRGESPEAEAARDRLPETVARAIEGANFSSLVPMQDIAERASTGQRPTVRQRGPRLVVTHGAGVGIGRNPAVSAENRTQIDRIRVKRPSA
jgi:hypothetical protein